MKNRTKFILFSLIIIVISIIFYVYNNFSEKPSFFEGYRVYAYFDNNIIQQQSIEVKNYDEKTLELVIEYDVSDSVVRELYLYSNYEPSSIASIPLSITKENSLQGTLSSSFLISKDLLAHSKVLTVVIGDKIFNDKTRIGFNYSFNYYINPQENIGIIPNKTNDAEFRYYNLTNTVYSIENVLSIDDILTINSATPSTLTVEKGNEANIQVTYTKKEAGTDFIYLTINNEPIKINNCYLTKVESDNNGIITFPISLNAPTEASTYRVDGYVISSPYSRNSETTQLKPIYLEVK